MKRIFGIALIAAASLAACNNDSKTSENADTTTVSADTTVSVAPTVTYSEGDVIMRDGKLMSYKNGDWVVVDKDVTLDNGTVVTTKGEVKKDGKVVVLEDGYYVNRSGNFFDRTGAAIDNAWDATKKGVENAAEATKDGLQKAGDAIKSGAEKVGDKTKEVVEDIKH